MSEEYDDDEFLTGSEADEIFKEPGVEDPSIAEQKLKLANAKSLAEQYPEKQSPFLDALDILSEGIRSKMLSNDELQKLANMLPPELFATDAVTANFDVMEELAQQRNLVNSLRLAIMNPGGKGLRESVSISEAKSVMDTCRQFGETIRKNMERVNNISRVQALEAAILETMAAYPEDFKREFTQELEKQLKVYCQERE